VEAGNEGEEMDVSVGIGEFLFILFFPISIALLVAYTQSYVLCILFVFILSLATISFHSVHPIISQLELLWEVL